MTKKTGEQSSAFRSWLSWLRGEDREQEHKGTETDTANAAATEKPAVTDDVIGISLCEPDHFSETKKITGLLKGGNICIVSLFRVPVEFRQRVLDFLCGVIYGLGGSVRKLDEGIVLFAPGTVIVSGEMTNLNQRPYQHSIEYRQEERKEQA